MDWRISSHAVNKRNVINALAQIRKQVGHIFSALTILFEFPTGLNDTTFVFVTTTPKRFHVDRLAVHPIHLWLVVESIDVAGTAIHKQKDDGFCFGREMGCLGSERVGPFRSVGVLVLAGDKFGVKQTSQSQSSKSPTGLPHKFTASSSTKVIHG